MIIMKKKKKWIWTIDHTDTTRIDFDLHKDTYQRYIHTKIHTKYSVSVWWSLYGISNTYATIEAQFMKKLGNTEAELK